MIAPPSLCRPSGPPVVNVAPFDCRMLPEAGNVAACQQASAAFGMYGNAIQGDCSRLPPQYQPYCRALPPATAGTQVGVAHAEAGASEAQTAFDRARNRCANLGTDANPREFYACLWATTKYPHYPEFGPVTAPQRTAPSAGGESAGWCPYTLVNRDNCPCRVCNVSSWRNAPLVPNMDGTNPSQGGWVQVGGPMTQEQRETQTMNRPSVWSGLFK
jgi:hypothetical protein